MANQSTQSKVTKKAARWLADDGLALIAGWARRGLTEEQIAKGMGISRSTLAIWKNSYPSLMDALKNGKDIADINVENALYKKAIGYDYEEQTFYRDKDTGEMILSKTITKHVTPDTGAAAFWLKNRRRDLWRDKPELNDTNTTEQSLGVFIDMLTDALKEPPAPDNGGDDGGT